MYALSTKLGRSACRRTMTCLTPQQSQLYSSSCRLPYPVSLLVATATQKNRISTTAGSFQVSPRVLVGTACRIIQCRSISSHDELILAKKQKRQQNNRANKKPWENRFRFVDRIRLMVTGGKGGRGCLSYAHMRAYRLHPNGGHGGPGGSIIIMAHEEQQTMKMSRKHISAKDGDHGGSSDMRGGAGKNMIVRVPCGVVVKRILDFGEEWDERKQRVVHKGGKEIQPKIDTRKLMLDDDEMAPFAKDGLWFAKDQNYGPDEEEVSDSDMGSDSEGLSDEGEQSESADDELENVENIELDNMEDPQFFENSEEAELNDSDEDSGTDYDHSDIEDDDDDDAMADELASSRTIVEIADLDKHGAYVVVARGGRGGVGTTAYSKMHGPNRPSFDKMVKKAAPEYGEIARLELELKLIADIGLVGFPNAGKSSLLRAMSHATPKVAPYPFTTLHPLLGVIHYGDGFTIRAADIPGLIAGASQGRGCGHAFLRHIERTKALLYILDAAGTDGRNPYDDLRTLVHELDSYGDGDLLDRKALVIANKTDLLVEEEIPELLSSLTELSNELGIQREHDIIGISAGVTGDGLGALSRSMRDIVVKVDAERAAELAAQTQEIFVVDD